MSVISTYLNNNAQTPLNRFVVYMLNKQVCNRHGDKTNRWSLGLIAWVASSAVGVITNPSCAHLLISSPSGNENCFYCKSTVAQTTRGSAMAEALRDALVSINSATYKTSHLKTRVPGLSCGIICRRTDRRTDRHTTTACTALSIVSHGKNRP